MRQKQHRPAFDAFAGVRCKCEHLLRHHGHWLNSSAHDPDVSCLRCWHCPCEAPEVLL